MPSAYGRRKNAAQYYQYGGVPYHYLYDWDGMPPGQVYPQRSGRGLGDDQFIDVQAHFHKSLADYTDYPVSMSMESATRGVRHSGPEQTHIMDAKPMGLFDSLSNNEKTLTYLAIGSALAFVGWKFMKRRRNPPKKPGRRRRRR